MLHRKTNAKRRMGLLKQAVSLTLCAALFTGAAAGAVDTSGTASSCTCGCAACSGTSIADIAETSLPFVVSITNISVQEAQQYFDRFDRYGHNQNELEETTSVGSGIIFEQTDDVLYIVTNYHVVEDATTLSVGFVDDEVYEAELCGTDEDNDLAVLKVPLDDLSADTRAAISVAVLGGVGAHYDGYVLRPVPLRRGGDAVSGQRRPAGLQPRAAVQRAQQVVGVGKPELAAAYGVHPDGGVVLYPVVL